MTIENGAAIAVMTAEPDDLTERCGITFRDDHDNLDFTREAVLSIPAGHFLLVRHRRAPHPGTDVVPILATRGSTEAVAAVLHALNLGADALAWLHPDLDREDVVHQLHGDIR